jgi:hypothetical protein
MALFLMIEGGLERTGMGLVVKKTAGCLGSKPANL